MSRLAGSSYVLMKLDASSSRANGANDGYIVDEDGRFECIDRRGYIDPPSNGRKALGDEVGEEESRDDCEEKAGVGMFSVNSEGEDIALKGGSGGGSEGP